MIDTWHPCVFNTGFLENEGKETGINGVNFVRGNMKRKPDPPCAFVDRRGSVRVLILSLFGKTSLGSVSAS